MLFRLLLILMLQLLLRQSLHELLRQLSMLLLRSFAAAAEPSLADTEPQYFHVMMYPCYLLRLQGWDVSSWLV
jgi:hypothetical protein